MFAEVHYERRHKGKRLCFWYDGGLIWRTWLEGTGGLGCGSYNADDTLAEINAKLGTQYSPDSFKRRDNIYLK